MLSKLLQAGEQLGIEASEAAKNRDVSGLSFFSPILYQDGAIKQAVIQQAIEILNSHYPGEFGEYVDERGCRLFLRRK